MERAHTTILSFVIQSQMLTSILRTRHVGATSDDKVSGEPHGLLPGILAGVLLTVKFFFA